MDTPIVAPCELGFYDELPLSEQIKESPYKVFKIEQNGLKVGYHVGTPLSTQKYCLTRWGEGAFEEEGIFITGAFESDLEDD